MPIVLELVKKSENVIKFYFNKVGGNVKAANIYVSLTNVTGNYVKIPGSIANIPASPTGNVQVNFEVTLSQVQSLAPSVTWSGVSFVNTPLFFRATEIDNNNVESPLADALPKFTGVTQVVPSVIRDNPSSNSFIHGFSEESLGWSRMATSVGGALSTSQIEFYEDNFVIDRTIDGSGNVTSELIYRSSDPVGSYAKLITYTGPWSNDGKATKVTYQDSTKPA